MVNFNFGLGDDNQAQDNGQTGNGTTDPVVQDNTGATAPLVTFDASAEPNNVVIPETPVMEIPDSPVFTAEPAVAPTIAEAPIFEPAPVIDAPVAEMPAVDMFPPVTEPIAEMPLMDTITEPVFAAEPVVETRIVEEPILEPAPIIEDPVAEMPAVDMFAPAVEPIQPVAEIPLMDTVPEPFFAANPVIETPTVETPAIDMNFSADPVAQPNEVQASPEPAMPIFGEPIAEEPTFEPAPVIEAMAIENTSEPLQENSDIFIPAFGGDDSVTPVATNNSTTSTGDPVQTLSQIQAEIKNFIDEKQSVISEYETEIDELKQEIKDLKDRIKGEEKAVKDKKAEFSKMLKDTQDLIDHFEPTRSKQ